MSIYKKISSRLTLFLASNRCFQVIVGLLIAQAIWIALSARYPMPFDEEFHVGIIRLYTHHLSPFWQYQPQGANAFGAITRDPSFMYHYIMSFPLRVLELLTSNFTLQIIIMRFINIGLFALCLPLFRKLLRTTRASNATIHGVLLLFVLIPIVPMLAAQINYDNLILPLTALSLLMAVELLQTSSKKYFDSVLSLQFLAVCIFSSLVKYAFLPIVFGAVVIVAIALFRRYSSVRVMRTATGVGWASSGSLRRWTSIIVVIALSALFVERYGVNVVRYHAPVPDCAQVLTYNECQYYGPWIRDYNFKQMRPQNTSHSPIDYSQHWLYGMWLRSFFTLTGSSGDFETRGPLEAPALSTIGFVGLAIVGVIFAGRRVWKRYDHSVIIVVIGTSSIYLIVLWLTEYQLYVQTGQPVAINGRYLLPILPGLMLLSALCIQQLLLKRLNIYRGLAFAAIACFLWGGGFLTFALRSNDNWYWPGTPLKPANHFVQRVVGPVTPGNANPIQYLH